MCGHFVLLKFFLHSVFQTPLSVVNEQNSLYFAAGLEVIETIWLLHCWF